MANLPPAPDPVATAARAGEAVETARRTAAAEALPESVAVARGRGVALVAFAAAIGFGLIFALVRANRSAAFDLAITMLAMPASPR